MPILVVIVAAPEVLLGIVVSFGFGAVVGSRRGSPQSPAGHSQGLP